MKKLLVLGAACLVLQSCADDSADSNGNGDISRSERAAEMASDSFIQMKPGRWEMKFVFDEIEVPSLSDAKKKELLAEISQNASGQSCLTEEEAKKPGADFFGGAGSEKCKYRKFDIAGQNANLAVTCGMDGMGSLDADLVGSINDSNMDFDTSFALRIPIVGTVKLKGKMLGTHVGKCTGDE